MFIAAVYFVLGLFVWTFVEDCELDDCCCEKGIFFGLQSQLCLNRVNSEQDAFTVSSGLLSGLLLTSTVSVIVRCERNVCVQYKGLHKDYETTPIDQVVLGRDEA